MRLFNFSKQLNSKYSQTLRTLKNATTVCEVIRGIRELEVIQFKRYQKNFELGRPNSRFDINTILFKNPLYREVIKQLVENEPTKCSQYWNLRLDYWEPLFAQYGVILEGSISGVNWSDNASPVKKLVEF